MTFAEALREARQQAEMTQEQLAERLGVSKPTVSRWESGAGVRQDMLADLRRALPELDVSGAPILKVEPLSTPVQAILRFERASHRMRVQRFRGLVLEWLIAARTCRVELDDLIKIMEYEA